MKVITIENVGILIDGKIVERDVMLRASEDGAKINGTIMAQPGDPTKSAFERSSVASALSAAHRYYKCRRPIEIPLSVQNF